MTPASKNSLITTESPARAIPAERLRSAPFIWAAGIECTTIPHLDVDQFDWTQHDRFWKDDFRRAREEIGCTHLRYCLPWNRVEPQRGRFDWSMADERVAFAGELGLELMLDVMHFGVPLWLRQAVGDPEFPESFEAYASVLVGRYQQSVNTWCPFNEPLVSALFSGDFGFWPPHARKWRGYMPVLCRIMQGVSRAIRAIRRAAPQATILLCDAAEHHSTREPALETEVQRRNLRRFIGMDLLTGRVDANHPLYPWVSGFGISDLDLEWFRTNPQAPDILGLDYYPHSDWQLESRREGVRQRRSERPQGLFRIAETYWERYGIPMMVTETSIDGETIAREIWLDTILDDIRRLRAVGTPMLGITWWPFIDHLDWDGALTHRAGKIHEVGLYHLSRQADGSLNRVRSPLADQFAAAIRSGTDRIGEIAEIAYPSPDATEPQMPPIRLWAQLQSAGNAAVAAMSEATVESGLGEDLSPSAPTPPALADTTARNATTTSSTPRRKATTARSTDRYGIVVFSHLRWGFVWQRPQQFLSRFARKHPVLFVEEPMFDLPEGTEPRLDLHAVMPNLTVSCPHCPPSMAGDPGLTDRLREWTHQAIERANDDDGAFDLPLLWYYSPMDSAWSLGHFPHRGIVYDCMDELSQFLGAPPSLIANESRLMSHADIVFTGGYELGEKKSGQHPNVHTFGCGVEFEHFNKAQSPQTVIPPDIDFMDRPILGWMGVIDERVDYSLVGEVARRRPDWSFAMVGPIVKIDPNLLPHAPNLYWLGGRPYRQLPNYCRAFDLNMMCFAINAATQFINPTKGLEYMATGKPIISTPVRDVVRQWSDVVYLASTPEEFIASAEEALRRPDSARVERGLYLARKNSWERTVASMQELIGQAIEKRGDKPRPEPRPSDPSEAPRVYRSTPGS